jgi:hypothetical protein
MASISLPPSKKPMSINTTIQLPKDCDMPAYNQLFFCNLEITYKVEGKAILKIKKISDSFINTRVATYTIKRNIKIVNPNKKVRKINLLSFASLNANKFDIINKNAAIAGIIGIRIIKVESLKNEIIAEDIK